MKPRFRNLIGAALALLASTAAHAAADLAITAISASPGSVAPGESVTFTVTISNNASGTVNGASTTLNDYNGGTGHIGLTLTSTTATSIVLGSSSVTIPSIIAGSTGTVTVSFTVPSSFSEAGSYFASARFGFAPTSTATGTATLSASVNEVVLTAFGSGYTSAPTVSFSGGGGTGAAATAIVANGAVIGINVTAAGSGYSSAPTVSFSGGGGSGAAATAQIIGSVSSIAVAGAGSGYGNSPSVLISGGGGGSGAAASLSLSAATTGVGSVTVTNAGGSGYTSAPTVNFSGDGGAGATATISGAVSAVNLVAPTNGGAGYTAPTVSFVGGGGTGAAATATVSGGAITAITMTATGSGYSSAPTVVLSEAGSTSASLQAVITSSVTGVSVTTAGSGYTTAPTVSFTGGGGSGATASAQLSGGAGSFTVSSAGSNYTSTPTVTVVGGGTSGATTFTSSFATSSTVVTVTGSPDLQITALNYPAGIAYKGGDVIPMSLTYRNNSSSNGTANVPFVPSGSGGTTYFRIQVILSSDPVYNTTANTTSDDFVLTFFDVPILVNADGRNHTYTWNQLLPGNFPGSYYVLAKIDSVNGVTESIENDLTQNGNNIWQDVNATRISLLPTNFPTMYLASVNTSTAASGNNYSDNPSITADGRYVAFASDASDLIATGTDTNGARDIFLYDNQTSTVRRVNVSQQGTQANANSATPAISGNGSYIAFSSEATNLVLGDNNGFSDIFVVNSLTGAIARVSVPNLADQGSLGTRSNGSSFRPAISHTGRYIVFESNATNLVSGGTTVGVTHIYLHDRDADNNGTFDETSAGSTTTVLISRSTGGTQGNGSSIQASISGGGGYVAFATDATNLGGTVTTGLRNIYVRDVSGSTTTLVSFASGPAAANGSSRAPSINQNNGAANDGRYVAFSSEASNLVADDTNSVSDVFVWDRNSAATPAVRVSVANSGGQPLDPLAAPFTLGSFNPSISATGRYVAFASTATNLSPGDGVGAYGVLAAATISAGAVSAISITNPGNNYYGSGTPNPGGVYYSTVPTVTISGGGGSGATATAVLSTSTTGTITSITVNSGGSGYTSAPTVTINGSFNQALHIYTMDRDVSGSGTYDATGNIGLSRNSVNRFGYESIRLIGVQSSAAADIYPVISGDGRWVAIPSDSDTTIGLGNTTTNLITADTNTKRDVFLHDRRINALPNSATLPTVTITSPGAGSSALVNTAISLTASATTTTGVISSVQFFVNGTSVGTSSVFPYTATWTPTAVGTYTVSALTTDSFGNIGISSNISVTINAAPSVGITAPTAGSLLAVSVAQTVSASASATTPGATVSSVQFYANGVSIGTDTTAPYSISWTPATSGSYSLTAVATDSSSVQTTSAAVSVRAGAAPSVSIASPANSSTVSVNSTQTILASASSTNGTIASVQFYANGVSLGTDSVFPFTALWTPSSTGLYSLTAIATDNVGNTTTSSIISVTVTGSAAPTISITSPAAAATVAINAVTTITVNAASTFGNIASVQFFDGAASLGASTTSPFSLAWTPSTAGAHSLTAVATDSIGVTTTSSAVSVTVGAAPTVAVSAPANLAVNSTGSITATATANASGTTIASIQFFANSVSLGIDTSFPYAASFSPTATGTYTVTAVATDSAGNKATSSGVVINVAANAAPTVSITAPANGASVGVGSTNTITATASDSDGSVQSVQFFVNGTALSTDVTSPYTATWTPNVAGSYALTAVATDNLGATTTSSTNTISVTGGNMPTVAITAPGSATTVPVNSTNTVTATASAVSGLTIASVQFFANGVSLGTDTTFPYGVPFTPTAEGTYVLTATATDTSGNQTISAAITVTVAAGAPPTVAIGAPATGTTVPVNSANTVTATATAVAPATIASVRFFANGAPLGTDTTFPYMASWTPTATGTYLITALATDSSGASATSATSTITVTGGAAPTVAITSPAAAANLAVNTPTTITANATAAAPAPGVTPATIASVQFFANGVAIGTDTSAPYSIAWTPTAAGTYLLTTIATDTAGNAATSTAQSVNVSTATTLPVVTLVAPAAGSTSRYTQGTGVVLAATATDFDGSVAGVRFFANNVLIGTAVSTAPYLTVWTPNDVGTYTIKAIATDNLGNESAPATATVTIAALVGTGTAPTVTLTTPVTTLTTRSTIPINAGVSSSAINQVTFYDNGVQMAVDNTTPYGFNYSPTTPGTHRLYAVATDSSLPLPNVVVSPPIDLVVTAATSPQGPSPVLTTSATPGQPVQIGGTPAAKVNLNVDVSDPDGFVRQVQFLVNGVPIGTISAFPYTLDFTPTALTTYLVTALATDDAGNISTSAPVSFTTTPAGAPTVNITAPLAGGTVNGGVTTTITATITPASGRFIPSATNVQFLVGGVVISGTVTSPSVNTYSIQWVPPNAGTTLDLTARATDNQNVTGLSPVVTVNLAATPPPQANITSPVPIGGATPNLTVGIPTTVNVAVTFVAPGLQTTTAQLLVNNIPQPAVTNPGTSFSLPLTPSTATSNVSLTVRVTDTNGGVVTTSQVLVNFVNLPGPSVSISAPASGSSIVIGTATTVTATATPVASGTTIRQVRFFAGSELIGTVPNARAGAVNLSVTWLPITSGSFALTAVATDSNDNSSTSPAANVTITRTPATVRIDSPANGSTVNVNTPQIIAATAETTTGTVTKVDFLVNGVLRASDSTFPFSVPWTPVTPGTFALTAESTDNFGTRTTSPVITVTVAKGTVPTVTLSSPPSGATIKVGSAQTLVASAAASANSGTIKQVEFFDNNGTLGAAVTTFPYNFAWTPTAPGSYSLYAIATDTLGNQTASAAVTVTVAAVSPGAPSVSITSPLAGASLPVGVAANIAATATDADGTIRSVEFFVDGQAFSVDNVFPYNFAWTPTAPGSYVLTAKATDNGGNFTVSAPVTVTVSGGTAPSVAIASPSGGATLGVNVPQTIKVDATSTTGFIASVQFFLNGVPHATDTTFPYSTPWTPNAVGTYVLTARATDNLGNITDSAPVTAVIGASAAPTVSITSPASGSSYTVGAALTIVADAVDSDGTITQVAFFVNGAPQGAVDTVSPYNVAWAPGSLGNYVLTAQATDNNGNVTTSAPVTVTIGANAPPTVALTSPTANLSYGLGTQVLIAATANDADGTVTNVQFHVNGLVIGTVAAPPYNFSWRPTLAGNFTLTAVASDNVGNVTTSAARTVTITASGAPAVTFNNPVANASYGVGTTIPVAATTTGGNGPVAQVQFFVNGTPLGAADITAPYSATWTPGAPGTYSLLAVATDSAGISSNSPGLSVVINANNPPAVAITNPASGVTVNGGAIVNLAASATDSDGTIANVTFLANGNTVGTATASPYIVPWTPTAAGSYTVVAQAVDNSGNVTNSTPITVNVSANQAPVVRLSQPSNGSVVRTGTQTTIVATATDADGVIASVQFFANNVSVGAPVTAISSQGGYRIKWTPQAEGIYRITAVALDNSGAATTSGTFTVMAISQSTGGADTVFTGTYQQGLGEQGLFALIAVRGKSATFIGYTTTAGITRTFYFPSLTLDASGGFAVFDTVGRPIIQGSTSLSGVSGTLDNGRMTFIGVDTAFFPATGTVAAGAYSGSFNDRPNSAVAAIIGYDASIFIFAGNGVQAAASGKVDATGSFNIVASVGGRFIGKADPATGFLSGTYSGTNGGAFIGASASGVSFSDGFLKNLSTRGTVGSGADMLIAGFVVGGTAPKQVLIRAVGPTLSGFGVTGALADPQLQILSGTSVVTTNDNWGGSPAIVSAAAGVGAFPLPAASRDSAIIALLQPGAYTAQVSGVGGATGVALMEIYDVDNPTPFSAQKIMNLATRGTVTPGQGLLVAGFAVTGNTTKKLLIRGVGPSLASVGISSGFLADPVLKLVKNSDNSIVRENDNWETGNDTSSVTDAASKVGAFNLVAGGKDSVILINLPPGGYSAQVSGAGNTSGIALIEVYEVP